MHGRKAAQKILMFENAFNLRGFGTNNLIFSPNVLASDENLRVTFNEAPIKTFLCRVDPYLVIKYKYFAQHKRSITISLKNYIMHYLHVLVIYQEIL